MRLLAWLLCFASLLVLIYSEDALPGIVGENFTFPAEIKQRIEDITWKKNKDIVAEWDGQNPPTYLTHLRGRSVLKENGNLTIFNLEKSDAGTYELVYRTSGKDGYLKFILEVLDPPSEPKINYSIRGDNLVLNCTSDFQRPVNYTWKLSNDPRSHWSQEFSIPIKNIDATKNATCFITFSQTERSSEISLIQCISDEKGYGSHKRNWIILIVLFSLFMLLLVILGFLCTRGRNKCERKRVAQKNSPVHGSGEHEQLFSVDSQEQHNSDRASFSQPVHCENDRPEADRELNKEDSALKDKDTVNNGVHKEELSAMQSSTLRSKCAVDDGVTEEELTQVAEGGNEEQLNNSPS
ncbi:pregnancy-specific beta-1-glycoprotein 2 isoform X1 [Chiroxiphia lanceolata]|uniref:pregnancy-specific beta-1-glycoprotein 2 isoform X1 n=1 Tax=Chiroxiphia lanceolata TaxID=296741 RepID=UPI0013CE70D2|nr:pregnancy-specific beta-1-glycoprotein 2 isoform X1 [Chiroxiphia lanceolata]XP_032536157.1 pregnancy-specific beta-1-glycoprotein 2 isoform X1 [Chiroxiphia lanceolata]